MNYTINNNAQFNSLEISFTEKPSDAVREALKGLRFRWHSAKKIWYGYAEESKVRAALDGENVQQDKTPAEKTAGRTEQNHVRIYYNGLKIDGGKLIRCFYSLDNNKTGEKSVSISARDYDHLPADLFEIHNETDLYTDYFDTDRAYLTEEHPLFKYFYYAGMKDAARNAEKHIEYLKKHLSGRESFPGQHEYYKQEIERAEKQIKAFKEATDPGQPCKEDLDKINAQRQEAENARIAAEHEAQLKEREKFLCKRGNGLHLIREESEKYPIKEGAPVVLINWSEHPAFYEFEEDTLKLSITAAEHILSTFDRENAEENNGYDKTKFTITWKDETGETFTYTGRYDLGDNDGGLIQHIKSAGEWYRTHNEYGKEIENPAETNDTIKAAEHLAKFVEE